MGHNTTSKVFGIILAVVGFALTIISIWLLITSLGQGCSRKRGTQFNFQGGSGSSGLYWEVKPATRTGSSKFYHGGVYHDSLRRDPTTFCEDLVDRWTVTAGIGIIVGALQILVSIVLIIASFGGYMSRIPIKTMTIIWSLSNLFFIVALISAFAIGFDGHIHQSQEVDIVGPLVLGVIVLDVILSALLPCVASYLVLRKPATRESYVYTQQKQSSAKLQTMI